MLAETWRTNVDYVCFTEIPINCKRLLQHLRAIKLDNTSYCLIINGFRKWFMQYVSYMLQSLIEILCPTLIHNNSWVLKWHWNCWVMCMQRSNFSQTTALPNCIRQKLSSETDYTDWGFSWLSSAPPGKYHKLNKKFWDELIA